MQTSKYSILHAKHQLSTYSYRVPPGDPKKAEVPHMLSLTREGPYTGGAQLQAALPAHPLLTQIPGHTGWQEGVQPLEVLPVFAHSFRG